MKILDRSCLVWVFREIFKSNRRKEINIENLLKTVAVPRGFETPKQTITFGAPKVIFLGLRLYLKDQVLAQFIILQFGLVVVRLGLTLGQQQCLKRFTF